MSKKPTDKEASSAAKEAHSPDPETRKEAMATLREKRGQGDGGKTGKSEDKKHS